MGARPGGDPVHGRPRHGRRGARLPRRGRRGHPRRPPYRRPDGARGTGSDPEGRRIRRRRGSDRRPLAGRVGDGARRLRPPAAAEQLLHARPIGLDLRRRRRQPDVLAGAPARGAQPRGDLPLPPRLRATPTSSSGTRATQEGESFGRVEQRGRRHHAHRQPHGRHRHERAHDRPDDREDRAVPVREGRRRPRHRRRHDP